MRKNREALLAVAALVLLSSVVVTIMMANDCLTPVSSGPTAPPCQQSRGQVLASVNGHANRCYTICVLSDPSSDGPAVGSLPAAQPCAGTCTLVDCRPGDPGCPTNGTGSAAADRGLCL